MRGTRDPLVGGRARPRRAAVARPAARAEGLEARRLLSVEPLDPAFGTGGLAAAPFAASSADAPSLALDDQARLLVGGTVTDVATAAGAFPLLRFNADGTPDQTFGRDGRAVANPNPSLRLTAVTEIVVLPDGRILAAGSVPEPTAPLALARYNADGTPDFSFGTAGVVVRRPGDYTSGPPQVVVQEDGRIVLGGRVGDRLVFARLNADGSLDDGSPADTTPGDAFGTGGLYLPGGDGVVRDMQVAYGKIVAVGSAPDPASPADTRITVLRLNGNGTPDPTFGDGGRVTPPAPAGWPAHAGVGNALAIRSDGRLLVGGTQTPLSGPAADRGRFVVYALNADGSPDGTFATAAGRTEATFAELPDYYAAEVRSLAVLPNGVVVAAGAAASGPSGAGEPTAVMAAFRPDGFPQLTFGTNGKLVSQAARATAVVVLQPGGRIVSLSAGRADQLVLARHFVTPVVRVHADAVAVTTEISGPAAGPLPAYGSTGSFTLERSGDLSAGGTVPLVRGGTATPAVDYEALPASVSFTAGSDALTVPVTAIDDYLREKDETVTVRLAPTGTFVDVSPGPAAVVVRDNEGPDRLEPNDSPTAATALGAVSRLVVPKLSIHGGDDADVFRATASVGGAFLARATFPAAGGNLRLELYNGGQLPLAAADGSGGVVQVAAPVAAGATVYVRVTGAAGTTNPSYDLLAAVQPTAAFVNVSPDPRASPVSVVTVQFTAPVTGFDLSDLSLTRDGGPDLLTPGQTLAATGPTTYVLGNLAARTAAAGTYRLTLRADGSGIADAATGMPLGGGDAVDTFVVDTTPPAVVSWAFVADAGPARLLFTFSEHVGASLSAADLAVTSVTDGRRVASGYAAAFNGATNTATFTFTTPLPGGPYRAVLAAAGVTDSVGNRLPADVTVAFTASTPAVVSVPAGQASDEGRDVLVNLGTFSPPASAGSGPFRATVDWGDGSPGLSLPLEAAGAIASRPHRYSDSGTYAVTVSVARASGAAVGSGTGSAVVRNVPPTAAFAAGPVARAGAPSTVVFTNAADPSAADRAAGFRYSYDFNGDGDFDDADDVRDSASPAASFVYAIVGTHAVRGRVADKDGGHTDYTAAVVVLPPLDPPRLLDVWAGDGTSQRSMVRTLTLRFDQPVTLANAASALSRRDVGGGADDGGDGGGTPTDATSALAAPTSADLSGTTWVYTFAAGPFTEANGSLADGDYTFTLNPAGVTGAGGTLAAGVRLAFHRLFGDRDGNRAVNNADYVQFRAAFGSSAGGAAYRALFDFDGDGAVNNLDYARFRSRFGVSLGIA